jgi:pteridine reductase
VDALLDEVLDRFGRLDLLVTTASTWESCPLEELTAEDVLRSFRVNTLATFLCGRRAGLAMVAQSGGGSIVTIGDWAIQRPYLDHAGYFIAKGSIPTLTQTLAVELGHRNPRVRVNCVMPGPVMFPPDASEEERRAMVESTLTRAANRPEVVAQAVLFLARNEFVTGACLPVDGGRSIYAGEAGARRRSI